MLERLINHNKKIDQELFNLEKNREVVQRARHLGSFGLGLYFDLTESVQGSFRLAFIYQDIYMNSYSQTIPLEVNEDENTIDFYQSQQKL